MTPIKLIAVALTCLFTTVVFAADAAKETAPTKEIAAAKETPKAAPKATAKPAMDAKGLSSHLGDTKIDLRHCLKEGTNREIHRCTL